MLLRFCLQVQYILRRSQKGEKTSQAISKKIGRFWNIFVAFSENMNFNKNYLSSNQIGVPLLSNRPRIKMKPLPCPSRGPKRFWTCPNCFEHVPISKGCFMVRSKNFLDVSKISWTYRRTRHSLEPILLAKEAAWI